MLPTDGRWRSSAGKVTAGLAVSNGSLPPGGWLQVTCGTACTPGSAPGPTLFNEYGKHFPWHLCDQHTDRPIDRRATSVAICLFSCIACRRCGLTTFVAVSYEPHRAVTDEYGRWFDSVVTLHCERKLTHVLLVMSVTVRTVAFLYGVWSHGPPEFGLAPMHFSYTSSISWHILVVQGQLLHKSCKLTTSKLLLTYTSNLCPTFMLAPKYPHQGRIQMVWLGANGGAWGRGRAPKARGSRRRRRRWVEVGEWPWVTLRGRDLGRGCAPSHKIVRFLSSKRRVLVHSGSDKTYFRSAWPVNCLASSRLGDHPLTPPVDPPLSSLRLSARNATEWVSVFRWPPAPPTPQVDCLLIVQVRLGEDDLQNVWVPDTFFRNEKRATFHEVTVSNQMMRLNSTGHVWYVTK